MTNPYVSQGVAQPMDASAHSTTGLEQFQPPAPTPQRSLIDTLPSAMGPAPQAAPVRGALFTIPDSARVGPHDPRTIVIREISADEILTAARIAKGDRLIAGWEQAKLSIHMVDGRKVNHGDYEGEILWQRWSSKVKSLVLVAYDSVNNTSSEEDRAFLASKKPV